MEGSIAAISLGVTQTFQKELVDRLAKIHGQSALDDLWVRVTKHPEHRFQSQLHVGLHLDSDTLSMLLSLTPTSLDLGFPHGDMRIITVFAF